MIHDLFLRRYPNQIYWGDRPTPAMQRLFIQVAHIVFTDVAPAMRLDQGFFKAVHDALARELGQGRLFDAPTYDAVCGEFLTETYDLWKDRHGTADTFLKARLSLIELLFRGIQDRVSKRPSASAQSGGVPLLSRSPSPAPESNENEAAVAEAVRELNNRFRQAAMGLHYHNGLIQFAQDELTDERTAEPCWTILRDPKWANVDRELKEAIDRADGARADAAFHAAKALESTIKIISDDQRWTTGRERGAANYIDNLVSQKNGRFMETWEGEMLRAFFVHVRNPHGHGAGSQPPPTLTDHQTAWAIETAMSWIKSLIRRL
ncbi:AbiJ-NTD4 domain-containing protein [Sphingosinicella rhizophila]|uniref:TIGR02391 family protein n=1 Tax=Sphingosinicella rhizophila TaxID=3050082 RepID=A0ABU3QAX5_9SPHN|nr:hypothetical protein [Sphingosinicella sp. GR2756]MDT9600437.1 hypothetical protein [Sphingosinicella sp. GR2756]